MGGIRWIFKKDPSVATHWIAEKVLDGISKVVFLVSYASGK